MLLCLVRSVALLGGTLTRIAVRKELNNTTKYSTLFLFFIYSHRFHPEHQQIFGRT